MKYTGLFFSLLLCCSCTREIKTESHQNDNIQSATSIPPEPPDTVIDIDTIGCVILNTKHDTIIRNHHFETHLVIETYCTDQTFWDTTTSVGGKGLTTYHLDFGLYNYTEIKITMEVNGETNQVVLNNHTFKNSISNRFYTQGMLNNLDEMEVIHKDTSLNFQTNLFVPGDARVIINANLNRKGRVKVLSTSYAEAE
jgi:hypothetical protein